MLIDWFTVGAQALNFLILVWLMKRFLYQPILHAIDAREQRIARELADADSKRAEASQERDQLQQKNQDFEQQRAALWNQATLAAQAERQRLLDEARQAVDAWSAQRQQSLANEARNLQRTITGRAQAEVLAIARQALTDLASTSLEARMGEVFTRRLRALDGEAKDRLAQALQTAPEPALVRSAYELPPDQRAAIQHALNETFAADVRLRFEAAPELVSGVELTANGQKVAWSLAHYLASLERGVADLLKAKANPEPDPPPSAAVPPRAP